MAVGAIGNTIYVNQQIATVSNVQASQYNRFDLQNVAAQAAVNAKDEKVLEVRPAEGNSEVDSDKEHEKNEADQENKRNKKKEEKPEDDEVNFSEHRLDIKV